MINFDEALAPLEPKNTARLTLIGVKVNSNKDVVLIGNHAGPLNTLFQSLTTKLAKKHAVELATDDADLRRRVLNEMIAAVFSKAVITGWENVCERDGKPATFTPEQFEAFVLALQKKRPDLASSQGMIERWFSNPANFADGYTDVEELGKE